MGRFKLDRYHISSARADANMMKNSIDNLVCMLEVKQEMKGRKHRKFYREAIDVIKGSRGTRRKSEKELRSERLKEHLEVYLENSSLHGLAYIFDKRHSIRRVIWLVITVAAFGYAMQKVYESTVNYFSYPFNTARTRQYVDELEFPAVSFCNLNDMRMSIVNGTNIDAAILNQTSRNISGQEYQKTVLNAKHRLNEMIVSCKFSGKKCSAENFTDFYWMQGDKCFTFNSGKKNKLPPVKGAGVHRGLQLTINIQHYDYYRDGMKAGIHLILHGQDETPVRIRGSMIPPGFSSYIKIQKKKILNLKAPYKTKCGSIPLKYFKKYSQHTCWLEQLTDYLNASCLCKDFFMPGDIPFCSLDRNRNCTWPHWEYFESEKLYNCPLPCEIDSYYSHDASRAVFPSKQKAISLARQLEQIDHVKKIYPNITDEKKFTRDNLVRLVLYYDDLSYELLEQQPSYDTLEWLGDIGGQIGLFIGAGAMSYVEFLDFMILVIYSRFFESFKPKPVEV